MVFTAQQNFTGTLDGKTIRDLNDKIDYSKNKLDERVNVVEGILENKFYEEYFSDFFDPCINASDATSSNNNVCKSLERMANYILNSKEVKEMDDAEKNQYVFHTSQSHFDSKIRREQSVSQITGSDSTEANDNIIHVFKSEEANYRKPKTQKIHKNDLEREDKLGEVLRSYNNLLILVDDEIAKKKDSKYNRYLLTKVKHDVVDDMIRSKDSLLGVWGYHLKHFSESNEPDYNIFDFTNERHLKGGTITFIDSKGNEKETTAKGLIYFTPSLDPDNEFALTLYDLQKTIEKANLNEKETIVLKRLQQGEQKNEISIELDCSPENISYYVDQIVKKIIKVGDKYDLSEL